MLNGSAVACPIMSSKADRGGIGWASALIAACCLAVAAALISVPHPSGMPALDVPVVVPMQFGTHRTAVATMPAAEADDEKPDPGENGREPLAVRSPDYDVYDIASITGMAVFGGAILCCLTIACGIRCWRHCSPSVLSATAPSGSEEEDQHEYALLFPDSHNGARHLPGPISVGVFDPLANDDDNDDDSSDPDSYWRPTGQDLFIAPRPLGPRVAICSRCNKMCRLF